MTAARYLMGIDNGGTVTKAGIYDAAGTELAISAVKTEMRFPTPGHAEKDMDALWTANARVISEVVRTAHIDASQVAAVAVTGHGNGMYLVAADGKPAWNGINSADSRAASFIEKWYGDGTFERILPMTCQSIWAAQPAALLAWFKFNKPEVYARTRWVFQCKDYIRYRLTGEPCAELTDSSGTSLMNVRTLRYDPRVLELFGISDAMEKLPPVRLSSDICGRVTREAAAATGLPEGTPVAGGLFDIDACALATGITDPQKLCLIAGSWSINEYISPEPVESPDLFMSSAYCMPGYWLISEASATSASNLEWFVTELMGGEREKAEAAGRSVFAQCNEIVQRLPPAEADVVFLPFLYGSNAGPKASSCFAGLHGWHTKAHMLRAVYEGVVFSHRTHVERLLRFRGRPGAARIAGGAAKSDVWVKMFADILQLPIEITGSEELGAMGAAICAGVGVGMFASFEDAVARMVRVARTVDPDPSCKAVYDEKYGRYQRFVGALRNAWG